ncbi:2,3-bisphosphoglycerate-independent phosphoglycerate mutase [Acuticoccus sediminis]|uniref:2,3-bisphosphoglycerate-independent phosphoglycerate mutase n=1 Tax=Acuticoccus sediminis TaxID=2184697 RepID=A0A8B2NRN5_9HYPH|nr:2,3-bisphosphoglycerate-independent phosphoglycerate mutase [Acuticoccus sediminis]RAH99763.1 2,3-bisphosphoglycerate-independent phosphoglycerate mutase [Acuticoccus sediminis]
MPTPVMLMILDGWGWSDTREANAVRLADTPNFDRLYSANPHAFLTTCGPDVGLPEGQMGNSEVGHLNIGAGRVVMQELPRIDQAIKSGDFAKRLAATGLAEAVKASGGRCHIMGLVSDGGVHSHQRHAIAVAKTLAAEGVPAVLHAFTDGRDTAPTSAAGFLAEVEAELPEGIVIATVSGRYYAMDRDNRWERVEKAYRAIAEGEGVKAASAVEAVEAAQKDGKTDEFILPAVIGDYQGIADGDALVFFNFRSDRAREILIALTEPDFDGFDRGTPPLFSAMVGMVSYSTALDTRLKTLFEPEDLKDGLAETVSRAGKRQIHLAETEKYPHVTYFLNGGREAPFEGEERVMVPSPKVATYDLKPEMSAPELTEEVLKAIASDNYDLIVVNFANPDMVGHTGSLEAAIKAVETVDTSLGRISGALAEKGGSLIFTADHGNCETMIDPKTGGPHTAHTLNKVPVVMVSPRKATLHDGRLADLSPTILALMGIEQPAVMTGKCLAKFAD